MKLNRRGRFILRGLPVSILALWLIVEVSRSLWWVGTDAPTAELLGYCWGSMSECYSF
jgi:hypothetical protein